MQLTPRLQAIASLVPQNSITADIGTDHAYVPVYLAQTSISPFVIACDILPGPLTRAQITIDKYKCANKVTVRLSDGLFAISPNEVDCVIVAGMGGILISKILSEGVSVASTVKHFILQPMTAADKLRAYLYNNGYKIVREVLVKDEGKLYTVIYCTRGQENIDSELYHYISHALIHEKPPLFEEYLNKLINKHTKKLNGLYNAKTPQNNIKKIKNLIMQLKGVSNNDKMQ